MRNPSEELRGAQRKLEDSQHKYFNLYNFAPTGYITLNKNGIMLDVNLTGAVLIGVERANILNSAFILYIDSDYLNKLPVMCISRKF